jgi:hypothetical protein
MFKNKRTKRAAIILISATVLTGGAFSMQSCKPDNNTMGKILYLALCITNNRCPDQPGVVPKPDSVPTYSCPAGCAEGSCIAGTFHGGATGECYRTSTCVSCGPLSEGGGGGAGGIPITFGLTVPESTSPSIVQIDPPLSSGTLAQAGKIRIQFDRQMDATSADFVGSMGNEASPIREFTKTVVVNDTLIISPNSSWSVGYSRDMRVLIKDVDGNSTYTDLLYTVGNPAPPPGPDPIPPWVLCLFTNIC